MKSPFSCTVMAGMILDAVSTVAVDVGPGERPLAGVTEVECDADVDADAYVEDFLFLILLLLFRPLRMRKSDW